MTDSSMPPSPPSRPASTVPAPTNGFAVASLVLGILGWTLLPALGSIGAIVFGHLARAQIRRQPAEGDGLAVAGLLLGWIAVALWLLGVLALILFFGGVAVLAAGLNL